MAKPIQNNIRNCADGRADFDPEKTRLRVREHTDELFREICDLEKRHWQKGLRSPKAMLKNLLHRRFCKTGIPFELNAVAHLLYTIDEAFCRDLEPRFKIEDWIAHAMSIPEVTELRRAMTVVTKAFPRISSAVKRTTRVLPGDDAGDDKTIHFEKVRLRFEVMRPLGVRYIEDPSETSVPKDPGANLMRCLAFSGRRLSFAVARTKNGTYSPIKTEEASIQASRVYRPKSSVNILDGIFYIDNKSRNKKSEITPSPVSAVTPIEFAARTIARLANVTEGKKSPLLVSVMDHSGVLNPFELQKRLTSSPLARPVGFVYYPVGAHRQERDNTIRLINENRSVRVQKRKDRKAQKELSECEAKKAIEDT